MNFKTKIIIQDRVKIVFLMKISRFIRIIQNSWMKNLFKSVILFLKSKDYFMIQWPYKEFDLICAHTWVTTIISNGNKVIHDPANVWIFWLIFNWFYLELLMQDESRNCPQVVISSDTMTKALLWILLDIS